MRIPRTPPRPDELIGSLFQKPEVMQRVLSGDLYRPTIGDRYLHWDKLAYRAIPEGLTPAEWWAAIKLARRAMYKPLPLIDSAGASFRLALPDQLQRQLSEIDRDLSGRVKLPEELTSSDTRDRYMISALIEEAITSSQLEGASTTGAVARAMLRSRRKPRDRSERMIYNNFNAMQFVREIQESSLTPALICDIHRRVTEDALDDESCAGTIRSTNDIRVFDYDGTILHVPPPAHELPDRISLLCEFANERIPQHYIHPVVRATLLHFWLAYDHPFADGNGRTARALFYWSMLHSGYWLAEFISISHILRKAPARYARSFLYTETDENDATYFVLYQLSVLQRGIAALHEYIRAKVKVLQQTRLILRQSQAFNHRQLALLGHAMSHPDAYYTVNSHATSHQVTRQTARVDLGELVEHGFLQMSKAGKSFVYTAASELEQRLARFGSRKPRR